MSTFDSETIPVTILTGFLGSGKTTLLNKLLKSEQMKDSLVLINEYGDVSIDHLITETIQDDIVFLESGCICCTLRGELQVTLLDLFAQRDAGILPPFEHVIIETTGLADPLPILQILMTDKLLMECFHFFGLLCIADAMFVQETVCEYDISVKQLALADLIIVSKSDQLTECQLTDSVNIVRKINNEADIILSNDIDELNTRLSDSFIAKSEDKFSIECNCGCSSHDHHHNCNEHKEHSHLTDITTFTIFPKNEYTDCQVKEILEGVISNSEVLRVKGFIKTTDSENPKLIQGVQSILSPLVELNSWPSDDDRDRVVFIGKDFCKEKLKEEFI